MARSFNGSSDYISLPDAAIYDFAAGSDFTVSCWVKTTDAAADRSIIEKWDGSGGYPFVIRLNSAGTGRVTGARYDGTVNPGVSPATTILNNGNWHHVQFAKLGSILSFIVDGGLPANSITTSTDTTSATTSNASLLYIASRGGSFQFLNGSVANLAIWNVGLTGDENLGVALGISPVHVRRTALVGFWPLWGSSPEPDFSGNVNGSVTINGTTVVDHAPTGRFVEAPTWQRSPVTSGTIATGNPIGLLLALTYSVSGADVLRRRMMSGLGL